MSGHKASGTPRSDSSPYPAPAECQDAPAQLGLWPFAFSFLFDWSNAKSELREDESAIALPVARSGERMTHSPAVPRKRKKTNALEAFECCLQTPAEAPFQLEPE